MPDSSESLCGTKTTRLWVFLLTPTASLLPPVFLCLLISALYLCIPMVVSLPPPATPTTAKSHSSASLPRQGDSAPVPVSGHPAIFLLGSSLIHYACRPVVPSFYSADSPSRSRWRVEHRWGARRPPTMLTQRDSSCVQEYWFWCRVFLKWRYPSIDGCQRLFYFWTCQELGYLVNRGIFVVVAYIDLNYPGWCWRMNARSHPGRLVIILYLVI